MNVDPLSFARAARVVAAAARSHGLPAPSFRSPPRVSGVSRTLRRRVDGTVTVAIRVRDRPWPAVLSDMVDGVVAANGLSGADADSCRTALWRALTDAGQVEGPASRPPGVERTSNQVNGNAHYRGSGARVAKSVDVGGLKPPALRSA